MSSHRNQPFQMSHSEDTLDLEERDIMGEPERALAPVTLVSALEIPS